MKKVGYKQIIEHVNDSPKIESKILDLTSVMSSRHDPSANKTTDVNTFLQRPVRYYFAVTTNGGGMTSAYNHACYFDKKEDAVKAHKELRLKLYDQVTAPFLKKINSRVCLTQTDKEKINTIIQRFDELKKVD